MSAAVKAASRESTEHARPLVRRDCEPCTICQAVRDGDMVWLISLPCGHTDDEVIWHSRPCVFVGCRPNLYLDVTENGSIKMTRPELEPQEMRASRSCVLDVASGGPLRLDDTGHALDVSRERVRQLEVVALANLRTNLKAAGIEDDSLRDLADRDQDCEHAADIGRSTTTKVT